ncbi:hypothetical protein CesoFtcFv8_023833 [Champsocephalus esox]|uniref:Uncharacterized protein n=1 Tax=Champsocephalus esox TaxID=159716 RepID=A0AAN8B4L5_9TELE|nr:hypothetical protein CesoFtcFv8_023833 [Champsocephalus esox]
MEDGVMWSGGGHEDRGDVVGASGGGHEDRGDVVGWRSWRIGVMWSERRVEVMEDRGDVVGASGGGHEDRGDVVGASGGGHGG